MGYQDGVDWDYTVTTHGELIKQLAGREEGYSDGVKLIVGCAPVNVLEKPRIGC